MALMTTRLDTLLIHQSPEGVDLSLSPAGPIARGLAWMIDFGLRVIFYLLVIFTLSFIGDVGRGVAFIGIFLLEWFYPVFFEVRSGMTPGKKALGVIVVHDDGTPVSWTSSLLRNLLRPVDLLPLFNMVGLFTMLMNRRFKRLGDLAAGTMVVYRQKMHATSTIPKASPHPPPLPLQLWQQRLILDFCERSTTLSPERCAELATFIPELTGENDPQDTLFAYGNYFLKGRGSHESDQV